LGQLAAGCQDAKGDGEVASRARPGQVRWSQVYDEPSGGERETRVAESRADPVPAFTHSCVRESDDLKERQPRADVHLDLNQVALNAVHGAAQDPGEQKETPPTALRAVAGVSNFPFTAAGEVPSRRATTAAATRRPRMRL